MKAVGSRDYVLSGKRVRKLRKVALTTAIFCCLQPVAYAQTANTHVAVQDFDIPAQSLASALREFAKQSQQEILFTPEVVAGKVTNGVKGSISAKEALAELLSDAGIIASNTPNGAVLLHREEQSLNDAQSAPSAAVIAEGIDGSAEGSSSMRRGAQATTLDTIVVTGTRIRGGLTSSPVITIGSKQIAEEGFTNLGEVIRSVPQNYRGGQNPGVVTASIGNFANTNVTGGSGLNLRGLGPDATLTLLNGRRLSYGGIAQAVDISAIPIEAADRVEIVTDGASAIYGSDAVAGVGNVILKRDFDGLTVGVNYGGATAGGLATREVNATAGSTWSSGGLIATYKYSSADPLYADQRSYTKDMEDPTTLYPGSNLRSGLVSMYQEASDVVEIRLDALATRREQTTYTGYPGIYYKYVAQTTSSLIAPSAKFYLSNDWTMLLGGAWGKDETDYAIVHGDNYKACYCNDSRSFEISAEGPIFDIGENQARLAIGAGYRRNSFMAYDYTTGSAADGEGHESSSFAYAEVNLPLIDSTAASKNGQKLTVSAAIRGEDYDSFGRAVTPKLGLIYDPSADFTLKASWGKSFKAPTLLQRFQPVSPVLYLASDTGGVGYTDDATVVMISGGNANLSEERARTWTASLLFHPIKLTALEMELTWFNIEYTDRVLYPIGSQFEGLSNPIYAEFVIYAPSEQQLEDMLSSTNRPLENYAGVPYDPGNVVAVMSNRYTNIARQRIRGLDLSGSYTLDLAGGRLTFRGSASWLDSTQQSVSSQEPYDLAGTIFQPAKVNSRFGATWNRNGFSSSAFANYTSGVTNNVSADAGKTASFTTFDANVRYRTAKSDGPFSGLDIALSVQNMLNKTPPLYTAPYTTYVPYDSSNYSATGRYVNVSISKHW